MGLLFPALCLEILMLREISRCGSWDAICIDIILGYDFQLYEQKKRTKEVAKAKSSKAFISTCDVSL